MTINNLEFKKMFAQRFTRAVPRLSAQLRTPMQRRFASTENAFIKEREAVKEHAGATTGTSCTYLPPRARINWDRDFRMRNNC